MQTVCKTTFDCSDRLFILWYQILGEQADQGIHAMFACLVPGFPNQPSVSPMHAAIHSEYIQ